MGIQHTRIFPSVFDFLTAQINTGQNKKKQQQQNKKIQQQEQQQHVTLL